MGMKVDLHPYKWEVIHDLVLLNDVDASILSIRFEAFTVALRRGMGTGNGCVSGSSYLSF